MPNTFSSADAPLVSSNPNCPITNFKIVADDGYGNPVSGPMSEVSIYKETAKYNGYAYTMEFNLAEIGQLLQSGEKLNYLLIAETAKGQHTELGSMLMWEINLATEDDDDSQQGTAAGAPSTTNEGPNASNSNPDCGSEFVYVIHELQGVGSPGGPRHTTTLTQA
jgi:hypothetical protein